MKRLTTILLSLLLVFSITSPAFGITSRGIGNDKVILNDFSLKYGMNTSSFRYSYNLGEVSLKIADHYPIMRAGTVPELKVYIYATDGKSVELLKKISYNPRTMGTRIYQFDVTNAPKTYFGNVEMHAIYSANYKSTVYTYWRD